MSDFFKDVLDGKVRDVRKWIERGENISQYDGYGNAAIHLATEKGYRGVCKVLIDAGADVNQRNLSVGWTAVHYAAYEGHTDLLRMLIAHGAIPDLQDSSGDTAETYAREWENNECITIIKEAVAIREQRSRQTRSETASSNEDMLDSDDKTISESEEDEDESSMMNWVMPQPQVPTLATQTTLVNNLVNNQFTKTVENLSVDVTDIEAHKNHNITKNIVTVKAQDIREEKNDLKNVTVPNKTELNIEECLDDLVDGFESSISLNIVGDDDTESEDTMKLLQKTDVLKTRESTPSKLRTESIVDRIKNSLSPAPGRQIKALVENNNIMQEKNESSGPGGNVIEKEQPIAVEVLNVKELCTKEQIVPEREKSVTRGRSVVRALSQVRDIIARETSVTRDASGSRERGRALSHIRDIIMRDQSGTREQCSSTLPILKENTRAGNNEIPSNEKLLLPIPDHFFSLSSATIPDDMTMSCSSIIERFSDIEGSESEKETLLKRLTEVIESEQKQVEEDISFRQEQLKMAESNYASSLEAMNHRHLEEEREVLERHKKEKEELLQTHSEEERKVINEVSKLENELQNLLVPSQLLSTLTTRTRANEPRSKVSSLPVSCSSPASRADVGDLEQELQCCSCHNICCPPIKIYQCPDGDLICQQCRDISLEACPSCKVELKPSMLSRNKVLENIAKKYFKNLK